jgi:DNA-binding LacI/PurR family transcriptional regulator
MAVTLRQIAEHANVSTPAVSLVLNGKGDKYAAATQRRIRRSAEALGYRPNASARATRSGRFGAIGLITRRHIGTGQLNLTKGVIQGVGDLGMHMLQAEVDEEAIADDGVAPRLLRELCVDGLVVHYAHNIPDRFRRIVADYGVPAVWVNTRGEHNCVYPDDLAGAQQATERLLRAGRRSVAYLRQRAVNAPPRHGRHYSVADREKGYALAMLDAGLTPRVLDPAAPHRWPDWLKAHQPIDALICYGPDEATAVMHTAACAGMTPTDLPVCCFHHGDRLDGSFLQPTILPIPIGQAGRRAAAMVHQMLDANQHTAASVALPYPDFSLPSNVSAAD